MKKKILVVEDNQDILEVLQLILEMEGYGVICLNDGDFLDDAVERARPNLILMDIMLGPLDGRDLCNNLKVNPETKDIPVIMLSASHEVFTVEGRSCRARSVYS